MERGVTVRRVIVGIVGGLTVLATAGSAAAATIYQAIDITPPGFEADDATGINPSNVVSFNADTGGDYRYGFRYDPVSGAWVNLLRTFPVFEPTVSADAINGTGQVAGTYSMYGLQEQAYRWEPGSQTFTFLPTFAGSNPQVSVSALNGAGQVIGTEAPAIGSPSRGWLWDGSHVHLIPTLGGASSRATDGYATGQAVGCAQTMGGAWVPIRYQNGTDTTIGNPKGYTTGCADAVNQSGMVAGESTNVKGGCESWRWKGGVFTKLPTLAGACVTVEHLSNPGEIVGEADGSAVAVEGSAITNLNSALPFNAGLIVEQAGASNLNGYIAAEASTPNTNKPLLLAPVTPVDDPALTYSGSWAHVPMTGAYRNTLSVGDTGTAALTFTGRFVSVIGACNPGYGHASITLDGKPAGTLDESSCGSALRVPLWWHMFSAAGRHTIVIRPTTSGPEFAVDAVTYSPR